MTRSRAYRRLNPTLMGSSQHFWFTTFLPRIAFVGASYVLNTPQTKS